MLNLSSVIRLYWQYQKIYEIVPNLHPSLFPSPPTCCTVAGFTLPAPAPQQYCTLPLCSLLFICSNESLVLASLWTTFILPQCCSWGVSSGLVSTYHRCGGGWGINCAIMGLYTTQCTVYSLQYTVYAVQNTVYLLQCTVYCEQYCTPQWPLFSGHLCRCFH